MSAHLDMVVREIVTVATAVDAAELDTLSRRLATTESIHVTGQGRSGLVARMVAMRLMHLGLPAHAVGEATAPAITAADTLVVISGSGRTPTSVHQAETARHIGAAVVLVSRDADKAIADLADLVVHVPAASSAQLGSNLFEQASMLVLDAVTLALAARYPDAADRLRRHHANLQ